MSGKLTYFNFHLSFYITLLQSCGDCTLLHPLNRGISFTVSQFARILFQISFASSGAEVALLQESRSGAKKLAVVVKVCFV